jgi:formylmethanofuran dehydrogenase subunit A
MSRADVDDLLIRGGHVVDGTGGPGRDADVAVRGDRIAAIEPRSSRSARRVVDARSLIVAPGLIDIHTHSDFTLPLNPRAESKIRQGVTTEVVGNCGFSFNQNLYGPGFVYCVDRAFVSTVTTPCLVLAGNDEAHPLPISEELAKLLPNCEFIREWKSGDALTSARARVKEFLTKHTP